MAAAAGDVQPRRDGGDDDPRRVGLRLEYATTGWNVIEVAVTLALGVAAGSLALIAFGLDSAIEVFASLVVIWHLRGDDERTDPRRARRALRLIAAAFAALGVYLAADAVHAIVAGNVPATSRLGVAFMAATVLVMLGLAAAKRRAGRRLGSRPLVANAKLTFIDGCLAFGVCVALAVEVEFGWWWSDPIAAAVVALLAVAEGVRGWREAADPQPAV